MKGEPLGIYTNGDNEVRLTFTWRNLEVSDYDVCVLDNGKYSINVLTHETIHQRQQYAQKMQIIFYVSMPVSVVLSYGIYVLLKKKVWGNGKNKMPTE